jgi:hypothetical protein
MGEEARAIYCGISQSQRRRWISSEYSDIGRLEWSSRQDAASSRPYGRRRRWDDSPSRSDIPSRRWKKSFGRKDDTWSVKIRSNRPSKEDSYPVIPQGYPLLACNIIYQGFRENSALGNDISPYGYSLSGTEFYSRYLHESELWSKTKYFYFLDQHPYMIPSQSMLEWFTSIMDFVNRMQFDNPAGTGSKWSPELQPPDESSGTSYDTYSYGIAKLFPSKAPVRKRNKRTSALPSNGANHQWVEQHHEVDDDHTSNLEDSISNSWGIENLNQWKQGFGMGRSRTWRYFRFLKSNRLCKPTKYPARLFERISWGNGAKLPTTLGRCIRPGQSLMSSRKPRNKAGYYDLGHLGLEIQRNLSWPDNNCNSEFDM